MMNNKTISSIGDDWDDLRSELFTPEEIAECDLKVAIIGGLIKTRHETGQKELETVSGIKHPITSRLKGR